MGAELLLAIVGGLIVGSFLNVVVHRLPRGESLVSPGSHCPGCRVPIRPWHNLPVISWLSLRGRCRGCGQRIAIRYPLVEAGTAALFAGVVALDGSTVDTVLGIVLVALLVPVALIDLDHQIIPNRLLAVGAGLAIVLGSALDPGGEPERLLAGAAAGGFLLLAALAYPRGMGMGDVKLAAVLGLFLGSAVGPAMLVALIVGVLVGAAVIGRKGVRAGRRTRVPFGPLLGVGALVGLYAGGPLVAWYLGTFA